MTPEDLRNAIKKAVYASEDYCARCKSCDTQFDAVMDVVWPTIRRAITEKRVKASPAQLIERGRQLHACNTSNPHGPWCDTCLTAWPCATHRALDGQPADGGQ